MCISCCTPPTRSTSLPVCDSASTGSGHQFLVFFLNTGPSSLLFFFRFHTSARENQAHATLYRPPRTSGLFNSLNNVCVGSCWQQGWFYKMYKHTSPTGMCACRRHASSSSWHRILIFKNGTKSPAASRQNVAPLGALQPFVRVVITGGVFIWACWSDGVPCQSGASAVSV